MLLKATVLTLAFGVFDPPVVTDGTTTAALPSDRTVRVVSDAEPLDAGRLVSIDGLCGQLAALRDRTLVLDCTSDFTFDPLAVDVDTNAARRLLPTRELADWSRRNTAGYSTLGIGRSLLKVYVSAHSERFDRLVDLRSGRSRLAADRFGDTVESLDTPHGYQRLCPPMRLPSLEMEDRAGTPYREPVAHAKIAGRMLTIARGRAVLQRCGHRPMVLGRAPGPPGDHVAPVLTRRYAAWVDGSRLMVRMAATGQRLWLPLRRGDNGYYDRALVGTERRLFVADGHGWRVVEL